MQFFENAPDIPDELIQAHEEDKLVFICGAGISTNSGLELFEGLTSQVIEDLRGDLEHDETRELKTKAYDKVFSLLERDHRFGPDQVRKSVKKNLTTPINPNLEVHKSILQLATNRVNELKLITTNFDILFEECNSNIKTYNAPLLPIPKPNRWSGLVHLHGSINDDLKNLVLSSSDFGIAYLTERWASRFITELFSHYTVLFIGYSADDSVMKYLIDAIAAERKKDSRIGRAFAFVASDVDINNEIRSKWESKNIIPIIYDSTDNDHSLLNKTLKAWSRSWSGGLESKHNVVSKIGPNNPVSIPENERDRLIWAISSDKTGSTARTFSRLGKKAPIEWLLHLQKGGILEIQDENSGLKSKLVDRNFLDYSTPSLSEVQNALIDWIVCHLDKIDLVEWLIDKGFILHPALRWRIQYSIHEIVIPNGFRKFWSIITSLVTSNRINHFYQDVKFFRQDDSPLFRQNIISLFDPILIPKKAYRFSLFPDLDDEKEVQFEKLNEVVSFDIESKFKQFTNNIISLKKRDDWQNIIKEILLDLIQKLKSILDLYSVVEKATENYDPIYSSRRYIEDHDQNRAYQFESKIIGLIVEAIELIIKSNENLESLLQIVFSTNYSTFRRIAYFISQKKISDTSDLLFYKIVQSPKNWLWNFTLRIEQSKTLPILWDNLTNEKRIQLERLILQGPERTNFRSDISEKEFLEGKENDIWELLSIIDFHSKKGLRKKAKVILKGLSEKYNLKYSGSAEEYLGISYSTASWGAEHLALENFDELSVEKIVGLLSLTEANEFEGRINSFRNLASKDPIQAGKVLALFKSKKGFNKHIFNAFFYGYSPISDPGKKIYTLIADLSPIEIDELLSSVTNFVIEVSKKIDAENLTYFLRAWDTVLERAYLYNKSEKNISDRDIFNEAYGHPLGKLTIGLFNYLGQKKHAEGSGLPLSIKSKITKILGNKSESVKYSITILTSRLGFLQYIDPAFTDTYIYSLFDFKKQHALWAWEGFLWYPYINPEIFKNIKHAYSEALNRRIQFSTETLNTLPLIIPLVAVELPNLISVTTSQKLMDKLETEDLSEIIKWVTQKIQKTEDPDFKLWQNIIQPWLSNSWPKKISVRSKNLSEELIRLILLDVKIFESVYDTLQEFLTPLENAYSLLSDISEKSIIEKYPQKSLLLVSKTTPDNPSRFTGFDKLQSFLNSLSKADKELEKRPEYIRLKEIALRLNQ